MVSTTATTAVLSWSPATTGGLASGYIVQVSAHGAGIWSTAGTVGPSPTGFTVTGLSSNTAYDFQVLASNASGVGSPSILATATTTLNPPNAPTGLAATAGSPAYSVVALSWTASATDGTHNAAATYTPQYQLASGGGWTTFGSPIAGTSVSVTGLAHATAYNFQVIASNTRGHRNVILRERDHVGRRAERAHGPCGGDAAGDHHVERRHHLVGGGDRRHA